MAAAHQRNTRVDWSYNEVRIKIYVLMDLFVLMSCRNVCRLGVTWCGVCDVVRLDRAELAAPCHQLEEGLESRAAARDRVGLERAARLAVKEHKQ